MSELLLKEIQKFISTAESRKDESSKEMIDAFLANNAVAVQIPTLTRIMVRRLYFL